MPGFAAIKLTDRTLSSVMASLSGTPGAESRFLYACLLYKHNGEDVYFVRGNYKNKSGLHGFEDHLFAASQLDEIFDWSSADGVQRKYADKPSSDWFAVFLKGSRLIDTLYDENAMVITRRPRAELQRFLKRSGGRYLNCTVQPYGSEEVISVRKYKGEFNGEQAEQSIGRGVHDDGEQADQAAGGGVPGQAA